MNFLVVGGTGYLGKKLICHLLEEQDNRIICIKRRESDLGQLPFASGKERLKFWNIDEVERLFCEMAYSIDWFINCACCYCKNNIDEKQIIEANLLATIRFFMLCKIYDVAKFLTIDTVLPSDLNLYCKAKDEFARLGRWFAESEPLKPILFYNILLENFYGEDEPKDRFLHYVIGKLKGNEEVLLTEGDQHRDFIYIGDVVETLGMLLYEQGNKEQRGYNDIPLGTGEGPTIREIIEWLRDSLQSKSVLKFGAIPKRMNEPDSMADVRIMEQFGIKIRYCWKDGMLKLLGR